MIFPAPLTVADRLARVLDGLCQAVAARSFRQAMATTMILLVWGRVRRVERQLQDLLARFAQGRLVVRTSLRMGGCGGSRRGIPNRLPRGFGWLLPLVPYQAAGFASQLQGVLAEPEMVALLAAAPQARRVMAPLCRMLGIALAPVAPGGGPAAPEGVEASGGRRVGAGWLERSGGRLRGRRERFPALLEQGRLWSRGAMGFGGRGDLVPVVVWFFGLGRNSSA